ncbi:MAG: hypothetical protein EBX50_17970 [Chitinophagia bacterium]|nr:hypothetical protein [Chitinophagia bacterium]
MKSFSQFIKEASFNVSASSRPELARFMNRGRNATNQAQTYPVQTQASSTGRFPFSSTISRQPIAPAVTQRNVSTTSYPVQTTAPTQAQPMVTGRNGQLTPNDLKPVGKYNAGPAGARQWYGNTALLSPKAADAFLAAQQAYGQQIPINSAYRNIEHQKGLSKEGHRVVGKAGTSRHGLGMAIDVQPSTPAYNWLVRNGPQFGWHFASIPGDPYHFEFRG